MTDHTDSYLQLRDAKLKVALAKYLSGEIKSMIDLGAYMGVSQPTLRELLASRTALEITKQMSDESLIMLQNAIAGATKVLERMVETSTEVSPALLPSYLQTFMSVIPKLSMNAGLHEGSSEAEKHLLSGPKRTQEDNIILEAEVSDDDGL